MMVRLGLRYDRSNVITAGFNRLPTRLTLAPADPAGLTAQYTPFTYVMARNQYDYFLPSVDLSFLPLSGLKLRFDASRTLTRPPLNEITPALTLGGHVGALTAAGNNPGLLPYLANNFDLGAEWYYGPNEYLAADMFLKHVSQFPVPVNWLTCLRNMSANSPYR